jgi:hypothetical protein
LACGELSFASGSYCPSAEVRLRHWPRGRELRLQIAELGPIRQPPVPQQVADLFERRALREIVDVVAVVRKNAAIPIQVTDG